MAARSGESERDVVRVPTFLPATRPTMSLRWALAASLAVHFGLAAAVLPNVDLGPLGGAVAEVEATDDFTARDVTMLTLPPLPPPQATAQIEAPRLGDRRQTGGRPAAASPSVGGVTEGAGGVPVVYRPTPTPIAAGPTPLAPAPPPVAPASAGPILGSLTPASDDLAVQNLSEDSASRLAGPSDAPKTFTEVGGVSFERVYDVAPKIKTYPKPMYSTEALVENIQGYVYVSAVLGADGVVREATVVRGLGHGLDEAAIKAVRQIRFVPATRNGEPVSVRMTIDVRFSLR